MLEDCRVLKVLAQHVTHQFVGTNVSVIGKKKKKKSEKILYCLLVTHTE